MSKKRKKALTRKEKAQLIISTVSALADLITALALLLKD